MQISPAGEHGQRFVRRVAADIRTEVDGVPRNRQKAQVCAVRVVNGKQHTVTVTDLGKPRDVGNVAEVIGRGDIHRIGLFLRRAERRIEQCGRYFAGKV